MLCGLTIAGSAMSWSVSVKLPVTRTQESSSNFSRQPGLYGMNFEDMPELHFHYTYFVVLSILVVLFVASFYYLRRKRML
jgi:hypothetical protein